VKQSCFRVRQFIRAIPFFATFATCFALAPNKSLSQYHQDFWTEENGLPQASVQAITQTKNGYIWVGTRDGLARFDGLKFTIFRGSEHPGLLSDDIRSLHEDNLGRLWIGTFNGGVSCLENGTFRAYSAEQGLNTGGVLEILQDRQGKLWFGTWGGITRFNRGRFENYRQAEGIVGKNGWSFFQDPQSGTLWAATDRAIHRYVEPRFEVETSLRGFRSRDIRKIHIDKNGRFWVGTLNGLAAYEKGVARIFTTAQGLADNRIRTLAEDKDGNLWVGTWDGLSRIQGNQITSLPKSGERINGMIEALFVDRDGSLWIGMRGGGLGRLRDAKFSNFTIREGLRSKLPRCIFEAKDGAIWIGSDGGGLARIQGDTIQHLTRTNGLPSDFVASVAEAKDGTIWAGLGRPAALVAIRNGTVEQVLGPERGLPFEYSVRAVFVDAADRLWAGGDGGLCRIEGGKIFNIAGLPETPVRVIAQDREGRIWAGSSGGLCIIEDDSVASVFKSDSGLSHEAVYSMYEDRQGTIWFGTQQGLTRFQKGAFKSLTREQGGFQGTIYQILEDDSGALWMASSRGISAVRKSELHAVLDGATQRLAITSYSTADGLKSTQCQGGSQSPGIKSRDGRIWFATLNGVAVARPSDPDPHNEAPPALIESMKADRTDFAPSQVNRFPAGTEDFEFHYTAIRFITPEKVQFRYRLVGREANWVTANERRSAYYNNLSPGKYTFQVAASSDGATWSEPVQTAEFVLDPYFYQTRWFYLSSAAFIVIAGFALHRVRIAKERERFAMLLAERTRIARDLHDTMAQGFAGTAFQLEALRSSLTDAPPATKRHLDLALTMVRHSFAEAKRAVLNLRSAQFENADLVAAVSESGRQMLAETGMTLTVNTQGKPRRLESDVETQLLRICQEAMANVIKHANASRIEVLFDFSQPKAEIIIKDNGSGFDLEAMKKRNGHQFGLRGMQERMSQLGGRLEISTSPGCGTEIKVHLN
jgi:ligand-binding sensor domain-containing protein/signal transduction histidine kinase